MRPLDALRVIMQNAGESGTSLARKLGKARTYIHNYFSRGIIPRVDTFSTIIDVCNYDLVARNRDTKDEILITQEDDNSLAIKEAIAHK